MSDAVIRAFDGHVEAHLDRSVGYCFLNAMSPHRDLLSDNTAVMDNQETSIIGVTLREVNTMAIFDASRSLYLSYSALDKIAGNPQKRPSNAADRVERLSPEVR